MRESSCVHSPGVTLPPPPPPEEPPSSDGVPTGEPPPSEPPSNEQPAGETPSNEPPYGGSAEAPAPAAAPPAYTPYAPPAPPQYPVPQSPLSPADRVRFAWQRRHDTDYVFNFWTALGWQILTCGIYGIYVLYQLMHRSKEHNQRRIELLDAATSFAWERANASEKAEELRPNFERISTQMATLRQQTMDFRDPMPWMLIGILGYVLGLFTVVEIVAFIFLDMDLVTHDLAEGAIESELSTIYSSLGAPIAPPDPARLKGRHNYVGRIFATIFTCGIYGLWWMYDIMVEGNRHFEHNWRWEDDLAASVQSLL